MYSSEVDEQSSPQPASSTTCQVRVMHGWMYAWRVYLKDGRVRKGFDSVEVLESWEMLLECGQEVVEIAPVFTHQPFEGTARGRNLIAASS